ncbi:UEV domain-containing protein [Crepidotus variabilis]|uniref:UEV domain-containing protein n=1 Tax=Crepidotus variabilis TaxID=179855 RepID=A0A9P6EQP7_9AGAR|nr:UEV domain-containing protein [Crepidotus variabilis]
MSLTQKWLRQQVQPYPNANRVYADIDNVLLRFSTLRPKSDVYTFDDGRTQLLLCVHGLLPITYRGSSYNIPMALWVPREYPRLPPISYVVPTNDMLVKSGKYVDVSGRCNIEYIQHWERKDEGCSLSALLEALQDHFSREPPVYSKPKDDRAPVPASNPLINQRYADRPPPPVPTPGVSTPSTSSPSGFGSPTGRPAIPSKPPSIAPSPALYSPEPQRPANLTSLHPAPPPPPPPHPPHVLGTGIFSYTSPSNYSSAGSVRDVISDPTNSRADPFGSIPTLTSPPPPLLAPTLPAVSSPPPIPPPIPPLPHSHVVPSYGYVHPRDPPRPEHPHVPIPDFLGEDDNSTSSLINTPPTSGLSLLSSTVPPRPPNPELLRLHAQVHQKVTSELNSLAQALALDAERLRAHQADLLAGEPAIKDEMARLEAVRDVCRSVATRTGQAVTQAETNITDLRRKGDPEVDELVCATTIVHNQLINLIADDNAIEDTIYHLHRALNMGRIDLERFLRSTRILAEEQFMKRALIEKIQTIMSSVPSSSIAPDWA